MQYRRLGNTGLQVSALGYGAMRLPTLEKGVDHEKAIAAIHRSFDLGVNYIDSALGYHGGESEVVVGKALKGRRDKVILSTKNPYKKESGEEWNKNLETQLKRLEVETIDFYLMHGLSWKEYNEGVTKPGGPLEMACKAREAGKIRWLSLSCHDDPENMIKIIDTGHFATITLQYNLLDRRNAPAIEHAHKKGMGVIAMGPVGGGRLVPPSDTIRKLIPGGAKSTVEAALRFVLANPCVSLALSGMGSVEQVEQNVAICSMEEPLSAQERATVEAALEETKKLAELYCTDCGYCKPCPQEVNIPHIFALMNLHRVYGLTDYAKKNYRNWKSSPRPWPPGKGPAACVECGQCEPKCPQKIKIIEQLKEVEAALGEGAK